METYICFACYAVRPFGFHLLQILLTSHSSLQLRLMRPPVRAHGICSEHFPVYIHLIRSLKLRLPSGLRFLFLLIRLIGLIIRFQSAMPLFRGGGFPPAPHNTDTAGRCHDSPHPLGLSPSVLGMHNTNKGCSIFLPQSLIQNCFSRYIIPEHPVRCRVFRVCAVLRTH